MPDAFVILPAPAAWRVGPAAGPLAAVAAGPAAAPEELAQAAAEALKAAGYAGQGTLLAVPSAWCLCAAVRTDDLPPRNWRQAMAYRLEERLPVSAEDVVADFVPATDGDEALGVCVEKKALAPLVAALEGRGVAVDVVCPAALLALQHEAEQGAPSLTAAVLWRAGGAVELFCLRGRRPRAWYVLPDDPKDVRLHLEIEGVTVGGEPAGPAPMVVVVGDSAAAARWSADLRVPVAHVSQAGGALADGVLADPTADDPALPQALAMAAAVLAGGAVPWVNLRRDDLAVRDSLRAVRTPLTVAAAAVVLCLVSACAAMLWRAHRYDQLADRYADDQQAVFREAFPGRPVPADVKSRLASEERSLRGLAGGEPSARPPDAPGLLALRDLLAGLPTDVRFRLLEARLDGAKFTLEGQANTHGDADAVAAALRQGGTDGPQARRFVVDPPRTEQLPAASEGGGSQPVSFTITGSIVPATAPKVARAGGGPLP